MPTPIPIPIKLLRLGVISYEEALVLQQQCHEHVTHSQENTVLLLQHPPTITIGKNDNPQSYQQTQLIPVQTDRGGKITAHEIGQLVVYPILHLTSQNLTPKRFVHLLEQSIIETLTGIGIESNRKQGYPGVWVGHQKICSLGVRIKKRVTMHGLALNVANDLQTFQQITPCGIDGVEMTTVEKLIGPISFEKVEYEFVHAFSNCFGFQPQTEKSRNQSYQKS